VNPCSISALRERLPHHWRIAHYRRGGKLGRWEIHVYGQFVAHAPTALAVVHLAHHLLAVEREHAQFYLARMQPAQVDRHV